ncbi:MAG: hypothetical protein ACTSRU_02160 [Candidatus Hodarchaeales archaeon]
MNENEIEVGKKYTPKEGEKRQVIEVIHMTDKNVFYKCVKSKDPDEIGEEEVCSKEEFLEEAILYVETDPDQIVMDLDFKDGVLAFENPDGFLALAVKGTEAEKRCEKNPGYKNRKLI